MGNRRTVATTPATEYDVIRVLAQNVDGTQVARVPQRYTVRDIQNVVNNHTVHQLLADYQDRASGGEGWLRILRFVPAEDRVYVQTYSPWLNRYEQDADSEFTLAFPMAGPFTPAGTARVASGATAAFQVSGLSPSTQYEW